MSRNFNPGLVTPPHNASRAGDSELPSDGKEPPRGRWRRDRRPPAGQPRGAASQSAACPYCGQIIRDQVAIRAAYCERCQDFTLMCAAGRRLVNPDVTTRTSWHWPCTTPGTARWQVRQGRVPLDVLLCDEHAGELAAGRISWVDQPQSRGAHSAPRPL